MLDRIGAAAPPCLYGLGVVLLAIKLSALSATVPAWIPVVAALAALAVWAAIPLFSGDTWYSQTYARAWFDLHNHAGGAVIAGAEADQVRLSVRPGLAWGHVASRLFLPAVFLVAALIVPAPSHTTNVSGAGVERAAARLEREMEAMSEDGRLASPDAEELRRQVQQLRELAERNPEAAAEALNTLSPRIEASQARRLENMADAMNRAADVMNEMNNAREGDPDAGANLEQGVGELFSALERMADNEGGAENLAPELAQAIQEALNEAGAGSVQETGEGGVPGQSMSQESLERVMNALSEAGGEMTGRYEAAEGSGQSAPSLSSLSEAMRRMEEAGGGQGEGIYRTGAGEGMGEDGGEDGEGPGSGGVSRGRADAPLVVGQESEQAGARFERTPLPPGGGLPDQLLRRERTAPSETMAPEEFRPVWRSLVDAPERVQAGEGGAGLGPARAGAAERYFMKLGETQ